MKVEYIHDGWTDWQSIITRDDGFCFYSGYYLTKFGAWRFARSYIRFIEGSGTEAS